MISLASVGGEHYHPVVIYIGPSEIRGGENRRESNKTFSAKMLAASIPPVILGRQFRWGTARSEGRKVLMSCPRVWRDAPMDATGFQEAPDFM